MHTDKKWMRPSESAAALLCGNIDMWWNANSGCQTQATERDERKQCQCSNRTIVWTRWHHSTVCLQFLNIRFNFSLSNYCMCHKNVLVPFKTSSCAIKYCFSFFGSIFLLWFLRRNQNTGRTRKTIMKPSLKSITMVFASFSDWNKWDA